MSIDQHQLIHEIYRQAHVQEMPTPFVTRLVKLLYLADLAWRRYHGGDPLANFTWRFLHFGPYAIELADTLGGPDAEVIELNNGREIRRIQFNSDELTTSRVPQEVSRLIESLVARWAWVDINVLLDHVYFDTEPMQNARRGEILDFSNLSPPEHLPTVRLDPKKLGALRAMLKTHTERLNLQRKGIKIPAADLESENLWDSDRPISLSPGTEISFE